MIGKEIAQIKSAWSSSSIALPRKRPITLSDKVIGVGFKREIFTDNRTNMRQYNHRCHVDDRSTTKGALGPARTRIQKQGFCGKYPQVKGREERRMLGKYGTNLRALNITMQCSYLYPKLGSGVGTHKVQEWPASLMAGRQGE